MEEKIIAILEDVNEDILTYTGPNMLTDELVDSFELIDMIGKLEDEFDIEIDAADVTEENFGNKDRIIALLKRIVNG